MNKPAKEVLKRIPRDEAARVIRHLLLRQPRREKEQPRLEPYDFSRGDARIYNEGSIFGPL